MLVGVDSYSYHRWLGELRAGEDAVPAPWSHDDVVDELLRCGAEVASLETCFLDVGDPDALAGASARLRAGGVLPLVSWGHPDGLALGERPGALVDLERWIARAAALDIDLVRIVAGGPMQYGRHDEQRAVDRLERVLVDAVERAASVGVRLALETHCELSMPAFVTLVERVPDLEVVLDTGNVVRVGADLLETARQLASRVTMVHAKDLSLRGVAPDTPPDGRWWCTAVGAGALPIRSALDLLRAGGFDGPVCVELMELDPACPGDERAVVRQSIATLLDWAGRPAPVEVTPA